MSLFTQSTLTWASAVEQIADAAGASGDNEMKTRAHRSLRAAVQYLNGGKTRWDFLRVEAAPSAVVAPFAFAITASAGQTTATVSAGHGVDIDDYLFGSGFMLGTRVSATGATTIAFNSTITGYTVGAQNVTISAQRDSYTLPTDLKSVYSVRLWASQRSLKYVGRRLYDRLVVNEATTYTPPLNYDLFVLGGRGKVRLVPPPGAADVLQVRYFRRMALGSASGDTTALDIPEDYEQTPIAWAKWHFLTDKQDARSGQSQVWFSLAKEGIQNMIAQQQNLPDEDLAFLPGGSVTDYPGSDKSTRGLFDEF